jgi:hypothetical protein
MIIFIGIIANLTTLVLTSKAFYQLDLYTNHERLQVDISNFEKLKCIEDQYLAILGGLNSSNFFASKHECNKLYVCFIIILFLRILENVMLTVIASHNTF